MRSATDGILAIIVLLGLVVVLPFVFIIALRVLLMGAPIVLIGGGIIFLCQMLEGRNH